MAVSPVCACVRAMGSSSSAPSRHETTTAAAEASAADDAQEQLADSRAHELLKTMLDATRPGRADSQKPSVIFELLLREWSADAGLPLPQTSCANADKVSEQLRRNQATKKAMGLFRSASPDEKLVLRGLVSQLASADGRAKLIELYGARHEADDCADVVLEENAPRERDSAAASSCCPPPGTPVTIMKLVASNSLHYNGDSGNLIAHAPRQDSQVFRVPMFSEEYRP